MDKAYSEKLDGKIADGLMGAEGFEPSCKLLINIKMIIESI